MKLVNDTIKLQKIKTRPKKSIDNPKQRIDELQLDLLRIQQAVFREHKRAIIVMEGIDTAGKGGVIRRLTRHLDPRGVRVWPIGAPAKWEQSKHYLYRFWKKLPEPGEIVIFDRSWYGRVLVERVEGFAKKQEWQRAYRELVEFERQLTDDGVILIKLFLHLSEDEQTDRLLQRVKQPTKRWKITLSDLEGRRFWKEYQSAYEDMLNNTATEHAPWFVVPADDKHSARVQCLQTVFDQLEPQVNLKQVTLLDPAVAAKLVEHFGEDLLKGESIDG